MNIKKKQINSEEQIFKKLGISFQTFYDWRDNPFSTQSRNYLKHKFIFNAGNLFSLRFHETEDLANRAGLTLKFSVFENKYKINPISNEVEFSEELSPEISKIKNKILKKEKVINKDFSLHFNKIIDTYKGTKRNLFESALISKEMFYNIKSGIHLRKEVVLALLIATGLCLKDIKIALSKAGYVLSKSLHNDVIIMWMLENDLCKMKGSKRLYILNDLLYDLDLPLLMARSKETNDLINNYEVAHELAHGQGSP
ncbi:MAG: hypothetical protein FWF57_01870 [Defluviitaleaceae bacterium]|nr:hypothetical protein [Defluviitaleaceae bacterium]